MIVFSQGHGPRVANCARHPQDENTEGEIPSESSRCDPV
ncbi:hypothetical protein ALC62_04067 [Cyphomyrmex costatus]|uniref:Uncharacterized protein n=1 Tax=Cyphomyrmex costatus TaxID=456900 RepID=A0A195CY54_9HYME|nr:hypothetical protein ALC62_04067 [Cyphomyrmex costatus]